MPLPFEQQPKEGAKAFAAFSVYLSLGSERSLAAVGIKVGKSEGLIERWSARFDWPARVQAHDEHFARVEREAQELLLRAKAVDWGKRQQQIKETEWEMHEQCMAAARRGLTNFLEKEKVYANLADIARILEVASKMGRLAAGMATDHQEHTGPDGGPIQIELSAALRKIYGPAEPVVTVEAEIVGESEPRKIGGSPSFLEPAKT